MSDTTESGVPAAKKLRIDVSAESGGKSAVEKTAQDISHKSVEENLGDSRKKEYNDTTKKMAQETPHTETDNSKSVRKSKRKFIDADENAKAHMSDVEKAKLKESQSSESESGLDVVSGADYDIIGDSNYFIRELRKATTDLDRELKDLISDLFDYKEKLPDAPESLSFFQDATTRLSHVRKHLASKFGKFT